MDIDFVSGYVSIQTIQYMQFLQVLRCAEVLCLWSGLSI